ATFDTYPLSLHDALPISKSATNEAFAAVSTTEGAFLHYGEILKLLETHKTSAPWLVTRREQLLHSDGSKPSEVMDKFRSIVAWRSEEHTSELQSREKLVC